jgi:hypothetical protein
MQVHYICTYRTRPILPRGAPTGLPKLFSDLINPDKNGLICGTIRYQGSSRPLDKVLSSASSFSHCTSLQPSIYHTAQRHNGNQDHQHRRDDLPGSGHAQIDAWQILRGAQCVHVHDEEEQRFAQERHTRIRRSLGSQWRRSRRRVCERRPQRGIHVACQQVCHNSGIAIDVLLMLCFSYYDLATDLYEEGWAQSFHFCRFAPAESFLQALARHEHYLAHRINITDSMTVLDVGCGVGKPAREIATFTGCNVVGLNNNAYQIERATAHAAREGLSDKVTFAKGDFMVRFLTITFHIRSLGCTILT